MHRIPNFFIEKPFQSKATHALSAGVLQELLEPDGDSGQIAALSGNAYGSICALLAWALT